MASSSRSCVVSAECELPLGWEPGQGENKRTFKGGVEAKASKTDDQIADEADEKDGVVAISDAAGNSFVCQVYEG